MRTLVATLPLLALLATGCTGKPCQTSNECGSSEVCASQRCTSLSCDSTWYAVDPSNGSCRPLPVCGNKDDVRGWSSCEDPCKGLGENGCISDPRCQPAYSTDLDPSTVGPNGTLAPCEASAGVGGAGPVPKDVPFGCGGPSGSRVFDGCHANPLPVDPCAGLDTTQCAADPRCVGESLATPGVGCDCPTDSNCTCGGDPAGPVFECRIKGCNDYATQKDCEAHPECTDQSSAQTNGGGLQGPTPTPTPNGAPAPFSPPAFDGGVPDPSFSGCFPKFFGCSGMDEHTCLAHPECHAVGTPCYCPPNASCVCGNGKFLFCEPDDGLKRCDTDVDCDGTQRCSNDEQCAPPIGSGGGGPVGFGASGGATSSGVQPDSDPVPPVQCAGLCVPKGCTGYAENRCNTDPTCHPIYSLNCSPYGGGGFNGGPCASGTPPSNGGGAGTPVCGGGGGCEPSFSGCVDADPLPNVDPDRSVLLRTPTVVDDPSFAFDTVMAKLANGADVGPFVTSWLNQIGSDATVDGRVATARSGAAAYLSTLPRRADGMFDVAKLGFQVTSLSNRLDLAGVSNCGEARITYALAGGLTDRRHRMTVIVELKQPDDGMSCVSVAKKWLALSQLSDADLTQAAKAIYAPLLTAANVNQVRTNEFLVGPQTDPDPTLQPWELREWRMGTDGALHLSLSKQAVDPQIALTDAFTTWAQTNEAVILAGNAQVPDEYLAVTSSENGSRINLNVQDAQSFEMATALDKMACAGCHTTEFNTAFAHVAERFNGTGRAQISEFLRNELPKRAYHLNNVANGGLTFALRAAAKSVH